jgi:hypothetical protein
MTTSYVVLRAVGEKDGQSCWAAVGTFDATSSDAAIRQIAEEGTYIAVPVRSWKQRKVTVETKKRTVLS